MANERYKLLYHEWVSTNNLDFPSQKELKEQELFFETKTEADEFFNSFKDDKSFLAIIDMDSNTVIRTTSLRFKKGNRCPFDEKIVIGSVACFMCPSHLEIGGGFIECKS